MIPMVAGGTAKVSLFVLALTALSLAGCLSGADDVAPADAASSEPEAGADYRPPVLSEVNADEATLTGSVVSDDFVAIAGAEVVAGTKTAVTDAQGIYVIEGLPPGEINAFAQADGFGVVRERIILTGGEVSSKHFILPTLPRQVPHVSLVEQVGFIECAFGAVAVTANCIPLQFLFDQIGTNPTNTVSILKWDFTHEGLTAVVLELAWHSPADGVFARELQLLAETDSADVLEGQTYGSSTGPSPVRIDLADDAIPAASDNVTGRFQTRVFPPFEPGNFVFQQKYTIFASLFYHKLPTPEYTGIPDGF